MMNLKYAPLVVKHKKLCKTQKYTEIKVLRGWVEVNKWCILLWSVGADSMVYVVCMVFSWNKTLEIKRIVAERDMCSNKHIHSKYEEDLLQTMVHLPAFSAMTT